MFDRVYIKEQAKGRMRGFMGRAIGVSFIALLLSGSGGFNYSSNLDSVVKALPEPYQRLLIKLLPLFVFLAFISFFYMIFLGNVIETGKCGWFLRYERGEYPSVGEIFSSFRIYVPAMTTALLRFIYTLLWSFLFIIPGIVMGFAYSMSDYIIYENPNISASRALQISKTMTYGAKLDLFVFNLSYIGWNLLSALTLGIVGIFYVNPYQNTALAGVYLTLKEHAIRSGRLTWEDFGVIPPETITPPQKDYGYNEH